MCKEKKWKYYDANNIVLIRDTQQIISSPYTCWLGVMKRRWKRRGRNYSTVHVIKYVCSCTQGRPLAYGRETGVESTQTMGRSPSDNSGWPQFINYFSINIFILLVLNLILSFGKVARIIKWTSIYPAPRFHNCWCFATFAFYHSLSLLVFL